MNHTPGPWTHDTIGLKDHSFAIWKDGVRLALVDTRPRAHASEADANARLIAAAPEMLHAVRVLRDLTQLLMEGTCGYNDIDKAHKEALTLLARIDGGNNA